jgi:DNA sulfur modification protein DndD
MIIKEIELNNFRIYKGYNKIDLSISKNQNIIIISGKNGYGKTTFLMSLVWCLYGRQMSDVDEIYRKEIENNGNYKKYIKNSLNNQAEFEGQTTFSVSVTFQNVTTIPDVTCKELKITRTYHTEGNREEELEILIDNREAEIVEEVGKETFIRDFIMPKEIAKFFFFDAEKIVSLAEIHTPEQRKNLSLAYSEVLRIKQYQDLKDDLENYLKDLRAETADTKEKEQLKRIKTEKEIAEERICNIENDLTNLNDEALGVKFEINKLQEKLIKNGSVITIEELNIFRSRRNELDEKVKELYKELKTHYELIPFAMSGNLLSKVYDQIVIERNFINRKFDEDKVSSISESIINELINIQKPKELIITHQIQEFYINTFKELLKKHFTENTENTFENVDILHNFTEQEKSEFEQFINNIRYSFKEKFNSINSEYVRAKNELNEIKKKINLAEEKSEDPLVKADREKKHQSEIELEKIQKKKGVLENEIDDKKNQITQNIKEIDRITEKLAVSQEKLKIGNEVEKSIKYLKKFISDFKIEKSQSLSDRIKKGLDKLLHKKSFVSDVKVEIITDDIDIQLFDSRNKEINKDSLSKGEQQLYATALLKGLVDESNIDFPVFIDSPMQKFDIDHSNSIVKYFYPKVSNQVIIFPLLKKELTKEEFEILIPYISKTYLIKNIDNERSNFEMIEPKEELFNIFEKNHQDAV